MKRLNLLTLLLVTLVINASAQDNLWNQAVNAWEATKNLKPTYCLHAIDAGAKGYASDYNSASGNLEGTMLYEADGKYRINVLRFMNKGETFEAEGSPTKEVYNDIAHTKENLIFAEENQKFLNIDPIKDTTETIIPGRYSVYAKIPNFDEFSVYVILDTENGMPKKVINRAAKSSKNSKAVAEIDLIYTTSDGKLLLEQYIEKAKIDFFGNSVFQFDAFVFSDWQ